MLTILFFAFVAIILYPLVRATFKLHRIKRDFSRAFESGRQAGGGYETSEAGERDPYTGRRKVYGRDEGEYVDFEEVAVAETTAAEATAAGGKTASAGDYCDSQVVDAEFEEIR